LEGSFRSLFQRETALYRDVVAHIGTHAGQYRQLPDLLAAIESQTSSALSLGRVKIVLRHEGIDGPLDELTDGVTRLLDAKQSRETRLLEADENLKRLGYQFGYRLSRDDQDLGLLLAEAPSKALTPDVRAVLDVLAGQIAIAIDDFRLADENVRLERKVLEGERLAALGQMAATVAHEVKNPLSAIKSIAQVMSEDEQLKTQHARDLSLIIGETDRLNKSVTQLLSFASKQPPSAMPSRAEDLARRAVALFRADAADRNINLEARVVGGVPLDGVQTAAAGDALSNLILNALQSTPPGGTVTVESYLEDSFAVFSVSDTGKGVAPEMSLKIWEPFFTTRQRGTGLGLAIVRKRMEEAGGSARLMPAENGGGARFELRLPVSHA
jgi:signal transduction histidine kinase